MNVHWSNSKIYGVHTAVSAALAGPSLVIPLATGQPVLRALNKQQADILQKTPNLQKSRVWFIMRHNTRICKKIAKFFLHNA